MAGAGESAALPQGTETGAAVMVPEGTTALPRTVEEWPMLLEERATVWGVGDEPADAAAYARQAQDANLAALCLSGGGERSAAFCLGVIQSLAKEKLLDRFEYLSTVSGGGYIGGWLSRWIHAVGGDVARVQDLLASSRTTSDDPAREAPEIRRLRARSNYLTPRVGLASADTWTAIVIVLRNLILNWLIFGPALLAIGAVFQFVVSAMPLWSLFVLSYLGKDAPILGPIVAVTLPVLLVIPVVFATRQACILLPSYAGKRTDETTEFADPDTIAGKILKPVLLWSMLLLPAAVPILTISAEAFVIVPLIAFVALFAGYVLAMQSSATSEHCKQFRQNLGRWFVSCLCSAVFLGFGVYLASMVLPTELCRRPIDAVDLGLLIALAPLWATVAHLVLTLVYTGFRKGPDEGDKPLRLDLDREWLARLSASKLKYPLIWAIVGLSCLVVPIYLFERFDETFAWLSGVISMVIAVVGGKSTLSAAVPGKEPWWRSSFRLIVTLATFVAAIALLAAMSHLALRAATWLAELAPSDMRGFDNQGLLALGAFLVAGVCAGLLRVVPKNLDVNRFSLHGLYRNRLVRAFLGSARAWRSQDPYTDFDGADNIRMAALWQGHDGGPRIQKSLFPVVNLAMNVNGSDDLAWQERKALSFSVTPLRCGWHDPLQDLPARDAIPQARGGRSAYAETAFFGGKEHDLDMAAKKGDSLFGISLGTAMTISGAAVNPSMGYHSSPATSFLMTLFNMRLGSWLPNPAVASDDILRRSGPLDALLPLVNEMTGTASARATYVHLSDGGHFDNLGLYEMVRRRCRYIVVVDAGADPDCKFADLGMTVRKIFIDQHVRIDLNEIRIAPRARNRDEDMVFCAVGGIIYPDLPVDPSGKKTPHGYLIYLKPSYKSTNAPIDVRSYAEAHDDFPHETTIDQWFAESQFESYRRLGEYLMDKAVNDAKAPDVAKAPADMPEEKSDLVIPKDGHSFFAAFRKAKAKPA